MSIDRRQFERKTMRGPARLTVSGKPPKVVRMLDISEGGICVVSDTNISAREVVKLEFNMLIRKSGAYTGLVLNAVVTYNAFSNEESGFKLGLQFGGLKDSQRLLILQYIGARKVVPEAAPAAPLAPLNDEASSVAQALE